MKYIVKYFFGGLYWLVIQLITLLWHFDFKHFTAFEKFYNEIGEYHDSDSDYDWGRR